MICRPLDPPYVSTVDSGNLAGHLITLANACREWTVLPPTAAQRLAGIADALDLAREATDLLRDGRRTLTVTWHQLDDALAALSASVHQARPDIDGHRSASGRTRCAGRDHGRYRIRIRKRTRRRHRRGHAVLDDGGAPLDRESPARHRSVAGDRPPSWRHALRHLQRQRGRWRWTWVSAFCSIPTASCSRSAIG